MNIRSKSALQIFFCIMCVTVIIALVWLLPNNPADALYRGNNGVTGISINRGNVGEYIGNSPVFFIEDINGIKYNVDDPNAFVTNNSYINIYSAPKNPIYITADKSVSVARANVKSVLIRNIQFNLETYFLSWAFSSCSKMTTFVFSNITINTNGATDATHYLSYIFSGNTFLTAAPTIPALPSGVTNANNYLYYAFSNCKFLITIPIIPALPNSVTSVYCYLGGIFSNCTSLITAPTIPALPGDAVTNSTYYLYYVFYNCTSLTAAPAIPALPNGVTSANDYYLYQTFSNCTSLTSAPAIPALPGGVTSADNYLNGTFYNCTKLTDALIPNIPPFTGTGITSLPSDCTANYAGGTCPATPDTPITTLAEFQAGYNYR